MRGGPTISPAILNTRLLKVPCTQKMNQLICDPLTACRALHPSSDQQAARVYPAGNKTMQITLELVIILLRIEVYVKKLN